ncbi:MAG: tRNA (N6-threonylcarbamoyladenosine(37)-N6)-methyltransferase TrmO [Halothiobacillaceae bacterium]
MSLDALSLRPIGVVRTPFREKFGIPRQGGLVDEVRAVVELMPPYDRKEAWRGIEGFSHLWLITWFHASKGEVGLTVRPPRLGGNARLGVFATRAPYRPNPMGLSLVRLDALEPTDGGVRLVVRGADLLDGTPLLDVKPYLPYADALPEAAGGFAPNAPGKRLRVVWSEAARAQCVRWARVYPDLPALVEALLTRDPRPAYQQDTEGRIYGMRLYDLDVHWSVANGEALIIEMVPVAEMGATAP